MQAPPTAICPGFVVVTVSVCLVGALLVVSAFSALVREIGAGGRLLPRSSAVVTALVQGIGVGVGGAVVPAVF